MTERKSDPSVLERASEILVKEGSIVSAPRDDVEALEPYIDRILEALGHPEAYVTDESWVSDFMPMTALTPRGTAQTPEQAAERERFVSELAQKLGVEPMAPQTPIVELAKRLRARELD